MTSNFKILRNEVPLILREDLNLSSLKETGIFVDVLYYVPNIPAGTFQQMLAINKNFELIAASNSYLTDIWSDYLLQDKDQAKKQQALQYESKYGIYAGIYKVFEKLITSKPEICIRDEIVVLANAFDGINAGHALGNLIMVLLYVHEHGLGYLKIAVQELSYKFPRILELLELYYPFRNWMIFNFDIVYNLKSAHFIRVDPRFIIQEFDNPKVKSLIKDMLFRAELRLAREGGSAPKNSKVLLIKQAHNSNVRKHDAFYGARFLHLMESNGWIIINPEIDNMWYIILLLNSASKIVVSYGAIMWSHMQFFNPEAFIIHLQIGNELAYEPVLLMKNFQKIIMPNVDLDSDENKNLFRFIN